MLDTENKINPEFEKLQLEFQQIENDYEKLSIVAREANVAVALMDYNGNFKWINSGYSKLYGYTFEQLINEKGKSIFGRFTDPAIKVAFGKCIVFKQTQQFEYYNTRHDGTKIWLQSILTPVIDQTTNKVVQLIAIDADISESKKAQEEIQQQKEEIQAQAETLEAANKELEKLSIVAAKTDNAIIITDANGNIEWVNKAFTKMFDYTLEEFIKYKGLNIRDASESVEINRIITDCIDNKHTVTYESHFITKKGETIWLQTTLTPTFDDEGNIVKLIAVDTDISRVKEAEIKVQQQSEELRAANDQLKERQEEILQQSEELQTANNQLEEQKKLLEFQHEAIKSSIIYALTIQTAILPPAELIDKDFENFVLYRPKDIVSGDFYWYINLQGTSGDIKMVAVVDCTGHGVPGAFMSMIGSRLLNEIVMEKGILNPTYILDFLNMGVKMALRQETSSNEDGMDVCFCKIEDLEDAEFKITFCGAKLPLYYYKNKTNTLGTVKGTRKGIGGHYYDHIQFTSEEFIFEKGDILYMASDGYVDQNNNLRQRFGTNRFIEVIKGMTDKSMIIQKEILETELDKYQLKEAQRDDITVLGIKL